MKKEFRAWDSVKKKMWYEEDIIADLVNEYFITMSGLLVIKEPGQPPRDSGFICLLFTGKIDKNGKKIWEGDIIKDQLGNLWRIVWMDERAHFSGLHNRLPAASQLYFLNELSEIIGNIYENPELLKAGER